MNEVRQFSPKSLGRALLWLGVVASLLGIVVFAVLVMALHSLHTPWYMPALGAIGVALVFWALWRRRTVVRIVTLVLLLVLALFEWWFVVFYVPLPPYTGPAAVGQSFPEFSSVLADGTPFTRSDITGTKDTVLVFFRGHW